MKTSFAFPLLFLGVAGHTAIVTAQSPGTFAPTGSMNTARALHTATLLLDGRVLIAGGTRSSSNPILALASAELYDPATGTFAAAGDMTTARIGGTATLLPDGRVLITGSDNRPGSSAGTSAELYDPTTGTFTATGGMAAPHCCATLLNNGKVLMIGGPSAELYDPSTGTFTATGSMTTDGRHEATLLPDGRVLIANVKDPAPQPAELYDAVTGTFNRTGAMAGGAGTVTLLASGKVLLAGGRNEGGDWLFASTELYDPTSGTFTDGGKMLHARDSHTATLLSDSSVLMTGGSAGGAPTYADAELYDPSAGGFAATVNMTARRSVHTATLLNDGRVLITGGAYWIGDGDSPYLLSSAELYNPAVLVPSPVLFSFSRDRQGQGAILHAGTARLASSSDPAVAGEALEIYGSGLLDGSVIPPQVAIGGRMAEVLFFGKAPGYASLNQVNVRVPSGIAPGPAVPVRLTYLGRPSNEVSIGLR